VPDPEQMRAAIDAYVTHMSDGDRARWLDLFADDARVEDPVGTPAHEGKDAIAGFWDLVQGMADKLTLERTGPVRVAASEAAWPMQAFSQLGDDRYVVDIIDVMTFDDDHRIVQMRAFWDPATMRPA
jgi:steroid delta-isomerase